MDAIYLYQQIAEALRQEILTGALKPGDQLPSLRAMTARWGCTPGTVQRAYRELANQGLVTSRPGQGTRVTGVLSARVETPLRRAGLVHRAETFLLEAVSAGHSPAEIEEAVRIALERWRTLQEKPASPHTGVLRFNGSHDPALALIASQFNAAHPDVTLELHFSGSLGGLIALAESKCDLAGCHLWDQETQSYNKAYIRRILPSKQVALVHFADRRLGLILPAGNPLGFQSLADLARPEVHFVNRQPGSGTRVWLDAALGRLGVDPARIIGYDREKLSHSDVAREVAEGSANTGFGLEASARTYGLDFVFITRETYHLVLLEAELEREPFQALLVWLKTEPVKAAIAGLGGYDTTDTGRIEILTT